MTAKILIVEDQNIIALDLKSRLLALGYQVPATLALAEEAVQHCLELRPDLVLMDIRLKGAMDGVQAAERLRADHDLPVIFLTAHSDDETLRRAQLTEPYGYMLKPFEDRELHMTIEIALYKHGMQRKLKEHERWLAGVLNGIGDAVIATDVHGVIVFANPVAEALTGWTQPEAEGRLVTEVFNVIDRSTRARVESPIGLALAEQRPVSLPGQTILIARDGHEIPVDDSAAPIRDDKGQITGAVLVFRDITERQLAEERLRHLAYHDPLTGLPNRALFEILVSRAIRNAERRSGQGAILFLDLDRFKKVNDTLGHAMGDVLLKAVAARLIQALRISDGVARIGGDEFTILIEEIDQLQDAVQVAGKILDALAEPFDLGGREVFISGSLGLGVFPDDGREPDTLLKNADTALYRVKDQGRNGYAFYHAEMNESALAQLMLETSLRRALQRDEFTLYFQPKVALSTGRIVGVEALLRWHHPELGLVPPGQFLALAEETGLILPIAEWVLRAACQQAKSWQSAGLLNMRVAVNLSDRQFHHRDLVPSIARVLSETGLAPDCLELELTERIIVHDREAALNKLEALKNMGVYLSIDDFGTGYSSLNHIKHFQVDALKIDQSFVRAAPTDKKDEAIVRAIVTLAHNLNIRVMAEGVETLEQHGFMKTCLCDETQGFFCGYPMPPEAFLRFMRKGSGILNVGAETRPA